MVLPGLLARALPWRFGARVSSGGSCLPCLELLAIIKSKGRILNGAGYEA